MTKETRGQRRRHCRPGRFRLRYRNYRQVSHVSFTMEANPEMKRDARTFAYGPVAPPFPPRGDTKFYTQSMEGYQSSTSLFVYLLHHFLFRKVSE